MSEHVRILKAELEQWQEFMRAISVCRHMKCDGCQAEAAIGHEEMTAALASQPERGECERCKGEGCFLAPQRPGSYRAKTYPCTDCWGTTPPPARKEETT